METHASFERPTLAQIHVGTGESLPTLRTRLRVLSANTRTHRQTDLVRVLATTIAGLPAP